MGSEQQPTLDGSVGPVKVRLQGIWLIGSVLVAALILTIGWMIHRNQEQNRHLIRNHNIQADKQHRSIEETLKAMIWVGSRTEVEKERLNLRKPSKIREMERRSYERND